MSGEDERIREIGQLGQEEYTPGDSYTQSGGGGPDDNSRDRRLSWTWTGLSYILPRDLGSEEADVTMDFTDNSATWEAGAEA